MTYQRVEAPGRPPLLVAFGGVAMVILLVVFGVGACIVFLESGADSGEVAVGQAGAFSPGTVEYYSERNLFIVRLRDGSFHVVSDLDAANRANDQRRCRVRLVAGNDPAVAERMDRLGARLTPVAAATTVVFTEDCNGAIYDITGVRLDVDGPNLDTYPSHIDERSQLVADLSRRTCTERTEGELALAVRCP